MHQRMQHAPWAHRRTRGWLALALAPSPPHRLVGDAIVGINTQCFVKTQLDKKNRVPFWANLVLKVNAKMGGVNFVCNNPNGGILVSKRKNIMILGGDVTHPQGEAGDSNSLASLVASMDSDGGRFISCIELNPPRVDIIESLGDMFEDLLMKCVGCCRPVVLPLSCCCSHCWRAPPTRARTRLYQCPHPTPHPHAHANMTCGRRRSRRSR